MKKRSIPFIVFRFYLEGFRNMTKQSKVLWCIILIKLFIMFCLLRPIFFSRYLEKFETDSGKAEYVSSELVNRAIHP
ncbi:MAG: DUF4492 domain-containing protein [Tannerella sp.]|nr:DUF4492 domain-containing protein [Tannerella sp.]